MGLRPRYSGWLWFKYRPDFELLSINFKYRPQLRTATWLWKSSCMTMLVAKIVRMVEVRNTNLHAHDHFPQSEKRKIGCFKENLFFKILRKFFIGYNGNRISMRKTYLWEESPQRWVHSYVSKKPIYDTHLRYSRAQYFNRKYSWLFTPVSILTHRSHKTISYKVESREGAFPGSYQTI